MVRPLARGPGAVATRRRGGRDARAATWSAGAGTRADTGRGGGQDARASGHRSGGRGASVRDVGAVVTGVPRPGRRGQGPAPTPVAAAARTLGLPFIEVETVKSGHGFDALARAGADVLAVVAYGEILPAGILNIPTIAPVNVHFSLLPTLRGASPVQTALLLGMDRTGVTTIRMDTGMDTGPILRHRAEPIREDDDSGSLGARLSRIGADLLVETLDDLSGGQASPIPQDDSLATYAPKRVPAGRRA